MDMNITHQEKQVRTYLDSLIQKNRLPGIQYVVVDEQDLRFEYCGGWRDIGAKLLVTEQTTFMASSSTKVLTAAAILQLVERGQIELDKSLSAYYPAHPYADQVTIRHLLNQTSGIANPAPVKWLHTVEEHPTFDEAQALKKVLNTYPKLAFPPGDKYAYSNISYWLLGQVIQEVSGQCYCDYMRQDIFQPLNIGLAYLDCLIPDLTRHAGGYQKLSPLGFILYLMVDKKLRGGTESGWFRLKPTYMNGPAYGGLIGTARGFARFLQDQLRARPALFGAETKALFFSPQRNNHGQGIETTLGWHRGQVAGVPYYGKPGGGPGFRSNLRLYPTRSLATAWLANETGINDKPINELADALDQHFLN
jgi:CubicO group peptidase (beta-lactamase class C family)